MNGLTTKYETLLKEMDGPYLLKDLPPHKMDLPGLVKYLKSHNMSISDLTPEEKATFIFE